MVQTKILRDHKITEQRNPNFEELRATKRSRNSFAVQKELTERMLGLPLKDASTFGKFKFEQRTKVAWHTEKNSPALTPLNVSQRVTPVPSKRKFLVVGAPRRVRPELSERTLGEVQTSHKGLQITQPSGDFAGEIISDPLLLTRLNEKEMGLLNDRFRNTQNSWIQKNELQDLNFRFEP